jgi:hypothetical protein
MLTAVMVSLIFFVSGHSVETCHCELSQPLMNVILPVCCSTYIGLKHACNRQTHDGGVKAYPHISGHLLVVPCGSLHVPFYQFPVTGAVYICTEDAFPSRRLQELLCCFPPTFLKAPTNINFGDSIFIEHIGDVVSNQL